MLRNTITRESLKLTRAVAVTWSAVALLMAGATTAADIPPTYAIDLVAGTAFGVDMNERGDVIGEKFIDVGCGFSCLAPSAMGVWTASGFTALPWLATWNAVYLEGISADGWIVGTAYSGARSRAVVWKPATFGYDILDLGTMPGTVNSSAIAIDDRNRVIGYSSATFPSAGVPFMWTESGGLVDLTTLGFPSYAPRAMSPGGTVAYVYGWYQLDVPGVLHLNAGSPPGFLGGGWYVAINDAGDQARFLLPTNGHNLNYLFRYDHEGTWQQLSRAAGIDASPFGLGSITAAGDITATISASGYVAVGPNGLARNLTPRLSAAYGDAYVTEAGTITEHGEILAQVMIGRSPRLVRLVEPEACSVGCTRVSSLRLAARGPNRCSSGSTRATASIRVTDENGAPLSGVLVTGHFFDDYVLDGLVQGRTSSKGTVRFSHSGPPCVGAIAFLVTGASAAGRTFDRLSGTLQSWTIPD